MQFRLLGPLEVVSDAGAVDVGSGKRRALLVNLLIHANEVVPAERLIDELWDEHPPATAPKSVQVYVSELRKALSANGELIATRGGGYAIYVEPAQVDTIVFEEHLAAAQKALADGDPEEAAADARRALELWRGPALLDVAYESFAQAEAARLEELRLTAIEARIEAELALGEHSHVASELESLVAAHPLNERFRAQLMLALYRCGRQSEALDVYRDARRRLLDELGIEPTPELRDLEQKILTHSDELAAPRRPRPQRAAMATRAAVTKRAGPRRGSWLVLAGGVLLLGAGAFAIAQRSGSGSRTAVDVNAAPNSMIFVDPVRSVPIAAVPLPGRPTALAVGGGRVWITTVDSASLVSINARTHEIARTVPLRGRPDAVTFDAGSIWVADGARGALLRMKPGYGTVLQRVRFPRAPAPSGSALRLQTPRATLAAAGGAVWLTNRSRDLFRVTAASTSAERVAATRELDAVTAGAGAVWALAVKTSTVVRVDPATRRITEEIPITARRGPSLPAPTAIAAGSDAVWVLNGNSATVTRINRETRGIEATLELGVDRVPADIAAAGRTAWVANGDGSLSRIDGRSTTPRTVWVGGSLAHVLATPAGVWTTTAALEQQLPGGSN